MSDELTDYERLRQNPSEFVSEIVGLDPFEYQAEFMDEDVRRKAFVSGRQVGKSLTCAWLGLHNAVTNPMTMTLITAPSLRQSSNLFKTLRSQMTQAGVADDVWGVTRDTQTIIEFDNGSEIHCLPTGRNGDKIRGYTADMIIVDEAAFIADQIFEDVLQPMTFSTSGDIMLASTPYGTSGFFYDAFTDESEEWYTTQVPSNANPLNDEEDLEKFKEGKTKNQIKREVLGEFVADGSSYFPKDLVRSCLNDNVTRQADDTYLGADIAAAGADQTVFVVVDGQGNVFHIDDYDDIGVLEAANRIQALDNMYDFETIVVDYTGLGHGTVEALQEETNIDRRLEDVYLTIQKKQAVYQSLKSAMEGGILTLPQKRMLRLQLEAIGYEKTRSGNLSIHAKGEFHDDWVDALALSAWALPDNAGGSQTYGAKGTTSSLTLGDLRSSSRSETSTANSSGTGQSRSSKSINLKNSSRSRGNNRRRRR